jgi:high-affinity iron transporter
LIFGLTSINAAAPTLSSQLVGSGLIGLREGLECGIVVMILIAFLVKSDRRDGIRWVWLGVAAAVVMTLAVFLVIQYSAYTVTTLGAEAIAGVASLIAVVIVTTMVLWMKKAAGTISGELREGMAKALEAGGIAVFTLAFLAVGREGFETALFMVGYAEAQSAWPLVGLLVGVLIAAAIAYAMYIGAIRINLSKFFTYTGIFLIVVAAGILGYGIHALQTVGWLPGGGVKAFDISGLINWSAWYGELIQGIFNITPTPSVLQLIVYMAYLVVVLGLFLRPTSAAAVPKPGPSAPDDGASTAPTDDAQSSITAGDAESSAPTSGESSSAPRSNPERSHT